MRHAITLYQPRGEEHLRVLADGSVPLEEQRLAFKALARQRTHPEYARIEFWTSSAGCVKAHRFHLPAAAAAEPADDEDEAALAGQAAGESPAPRRARRGK